MQIGLGIKLNVLYDHEENISGGFGEKQSIQMLMKTWQLSYEEVAQIIDEDKKEQETLINKGEFV